MVENAPPLSYLPPASVHALHPQISVPTFICQFLHQFCPILLFQFCCSSSCRGVCLCCLLLPFEVPACGQGTASLLAIATTRRYATIARGSDSGADFGDSNCSLPLLLLISLLSVLLPVLPPASSATYFDANGHGAAARLPPSHLI